MVLLSGAYRGPGWSSPRGVEGLWPLATPTPPWYGAPVFTPPHFPREFNLADYFLFDRLSEGLGDKVAILFGEQRHTYDEVAERVRSLRAFFTMTGLAREERVLIALHDTPAFVWAFFATLHHGAVVAMANPDAPTSDLAYLVEYTRAAVVITNPRTAESIYPALAVASLRALILVPEVATGGAW
jgi:acyl-coenzyme A synthetase/AMP-(fatty) acid ligase